MREIIELGEITIQVTRKAIKNVHLSVHPPDGHVTLAAPTATRLDVARAYAITKLGWIRTQREKLAEQARETRRDYVERESHYLWGQRYLLSVRVRDIKPQVTLDSQRITLTIRPHSDAAKRGEVIHAWHKSLLHMAIPPLIRKWETRLDVPVAGYFLQRMKTKWGSCNHTSGRIRLNTELVKKPKDLLEYVVVHEMAHLIEPTHNGRFIHLLDTNYPTWREARLELNKLPLAAETWASAATNALR